MNISGKSTEVPTACVAVVIVILAAVVAAVMGSAYGVVLAKPDAASTTTVHIVVQSPEESGQPDLLMNPRSNWTYNNDVPYWTGEGFANEQDDQVNSGQMVLPALNPLDISLLQSDGGFVHCKPFRSVVRKDALADGIVAINNTLLDLSTNVDGDLTLSPRDSDIQSRRIVIVVNSTHAAWLPATAAGGSVTLSAYDWLPDITMWWGRLQVCAFNG